MSNASSRRRPRSPHRGFFRDLTVASIASGLVAFLFAASGPVVVILATGTKGGLSEADLASWLFGAFFINGLISIAFCFAYRQPLAFFWTIPGTVLVGPALGHLTFAEVIGAFIATGVLMLVLGATGWVRRAMQAFPMPIVMGMVAGVFLQFGLDWVRAFQSDPVIAATMTAAFLLAGAAPAAVSARLPPLIVALARRRRRHRRHRHVRARSRPGAAAGRAATSPAGILVDRHGRAGGAAGDHRAGGAERAGHRRADGRGSHAPDQRHRGRLRRRLVVCAFVGSVSTCLTGPVNAIISSGSRKHSQYTAGVIVGALALGFGALSPLFTRLLLAAPPAFIATVAGLAMLRVLQSAFAVGFQGRCALGALVTFLVTVAGIPILNIGAPFWALIAGTAVSLVMERGDWREREAP